MSNFFLYRGKDERRPANVSATVYPLMKLTEPKQYWNKELLNAIGNWYTSIDAIKVLAGPDRKMHVVGTVKINKKVFQKHFHFPKLYVVRKSEEHLNATQIPLVVSTTI